MEEKKIRIARELKKLYCVESVYFRQLDGDQIRRYVDMYYKGGGKEVLCVEYTPECYACDNYVLYWEHESPESLAEALEI